MLDERVACSALLVALFSTGCFQADDEPELPMLGEETDTDDETEDPGSGSTGSEPNEDDTSGDDGPPSAEGGDIELAHARLLVDGLGTLADGYHYEGWALIEGAPVSIGKFNVDASGVITDLDGIAIEDGLLNGGRDLRVASEFILTIEGPGDVDITPSETHYLGGTLDDGEAMLTIAGGTQSFPDDFGEASGAYILATPTDGPESNETSGLWFLDLSSEPAGPGLVLPALPQGWVYEGWAVIDDVPVSTGRFVAADEPDFDDSFSGEMPAPEVPGEDFLVEAPTGWSFPLDLRSRVAVITIEPEPDDSPAPFALKPLVGPIPEDAATHHSFMMDNASADFPTIALELAP